MPDTLLDSRSEFDRAKVLLGRWLRENFEPARILGAAQLNEYGSSHSFCAGWQIEMAHAGETLAFDVLIDSRFPYSPIRAAFKSREVYLRWPHVEPGGLLCLPRRAAPSSDLESAAVGTLSDAVALVDQCRDPRIVEEEFRREFGSYWNRSKHEAAKPFRSLLDLNNKRHRRVAVWFGEKYTLVGESSEQLVSWLRNRGRTEESSISLGIFAHLRQAPVPPFPERPAELFSLLHTQAPNSVPLLAGLSTRHTVPFVLAASSPSGYGLIGMTVSTPRDFAGFRKKDNVALPIKLALWKQKSGLTRSSIDRYDSAWVHGRGLNKHQQRLAASTVLILGCGSLGSQVAVRLAQSGLGGLVLVDPEELSTANVGRHALGISSVGCKKATALASTLREQYPHMCLVEDEPIRWQSLYNANPATFRNADLIVACLGEWSEDGQLCEWQAREEPSQPVVYGWLALLSKLAEGR